MVFLRKRVARHPGVPFVNTDGAGVGTVVPVVPMMPVDPAIAIHVLELVTRMAFALLLPVPVRRKMTEVRTVVAMVVVVVVHAMGINVAVTVGIGVAMSDTVPDHMNSMGWVFGCLAHLPVNDEWSGGSDVSTTDGEEVRTMKGGRCGLRQASLLRRQRGYKGEPRMC